uniref:BEN domain-containing protein n=1 Tax=Amphimedon queenslandica TaxID=400682 RepID=A0A1X7V5T3_AMPQE
MMIMIKDLEKVVIIMSKKAMNPHCLTVSQELNRLGIYAANTGSDCEDNFVNPLLAEDGSFVGHFKDTVAVLEKCSVVDSEVLSALKDDVEYLKKKCDSMSDNLIERMYYLLKNHVAANKHISKFESSNRVKTDSPGIIRLDLSKSALANSMEDQEKNVADDSDKRKFTDQNTNLLHVHGKDCYKYALALMDVVFTKEKMASSCFYATSRSKKTPLPQKKVRLIEECIDMKYGKGTVTKNRKDLKSRLNQKCIDQRKLLVVKSEDRKEIEL